MNVDVTHECKKKKTSEALNVAGTFFTPLPEFQGLRAALGSKFFWRGNHELFSFSWSIAPSTGGRSSAELDFYFKGMQVYKKIGTFSCILQFKGSFLIQKNNCASFSYTPDGEEGRGVHNWLSNLELPPSTESKPIVL